MVEGLGTIVPGLLVAVCDIANKQVGDIEIIRVVAV